MSEETRAEILIDYEGMQSVDDVFLRTLAAIRDSGYAHEEILTNLDVEALDECFPNTINSYADMVNFFLKLIESGQRHGFSVEVCKTKRAIHLIYHPRMAFANAFYVESPKTDH